MNNKKTKEILLTSDTSNLTEEDLDGDWFYDDFREQFYDIINSNYDESKRYFVEGSGMSWRSVKGFKVVNEDENLLDIFSINGDYHLDILKGGKDFPLYVIRYSHDEPMGATFKIYDLAKAVELKLIENESEN